MSSSRAVAYLVAAAMAVAIGPTAILAGPATLAAADPEPTLVSEAEAMREAERTGKPVEVESLTTERQTVYADPSTGDFVAEISAIPQRVKRDGEWVEASAELGLTSAGDVAPEASPLAITISAGGSQDPLVSVVDGAKQLEFWWPEALPPAVLIQDAAVFPAVRPNIDLVVRTSLNGFNLYVVVHTAEAAHDPFLTRIPLRWSSEGLTLRQTTAGYEAVDASGKVSFAGPKFSMWSQPDAIASGPEYAPGVPGVAAAAAILPTPDLTTDVGMALEGNQLVMLPPAAFLQAPETQFPVVIDPVTSRFDTAWSMIWSDGQKFWDSSSQVHRVGYDGWDSSGGYKRSRVFYNVDVSALRGKVILDAELRHFQVHSPNNSCDLGSYGPGVEAYSTGVATSSTSWSNQPTWGMKLDTANLASGNTLYCAGTNTEWDVTAGLRQAADNNWVNWTVGLKSADETDRNGWRKFEDTNGSQRYPVISITYNTRPAAPTNVRLVGNTEEACGRIYSTTRTPVMAADVVDSDKEGQVRAHFYEVGAGRPAILGGYKTSTGDRVTSSAIFADQDRVLADGDYTFTASAFDGRNESTFTAGPTFRVDRTAPPTPGDFQLVSLGDTSTPKVGEFIQVRVWRAAGDGNRLKYGIGTDTPSQWTIFPSNGYIAFNFVAEKAGPQRVSVQVEDCAGNLSAVVTESITVVGHLPKRTYQLNGNGTDSNTFGNTTPMALSVPSGSNLTGGGRRGEPNAVGEVQDPTDKALTTTATSAPLTTATAPIDTIDSFSIAAYVKPGAASGSKGSIITMMNGTGVQAAHLGWREVNGERVWEFSTRGDDGVHTNLRSTTPIVEGQWTHLAAVYFKESQVMRLYVNASTTPYVITNVPKNRTETTAMRVGNGYDQSSNGFVGKIDRVYLFSGPIDRAQAEQLRTEGEAS